jgi:threonine dehydrogenase-like Zn-dependent dehydrogenase
MAKPQHPPWRTRPPLVTHRFKLDQIEAAYDLFSHQRDGVLKVAITA